MLIRLSVIFLLVLVSRCLYSQDTLLYENFIKGALPIGWTEEKVSGSTLVNWKYRQGGHQFFPDSAAADTMNACFDFQSFNGEATKLITVPIDLLATQKPELRFWHVQKTWTWGGAYNDQLRVYYKKGQDSAWVLLEEYVNPVEEWNYRVIPIPDSAKSSTFYIAFEGKTQYGHGTCVDEVLIIETAVVTKYLESYFIKQASTSFVASGTDNNPILRIDLNVLGNSGSIQLQSLTIQSGCDKDDDIKSGGVNLYYTEDTLFSIDNPIYTAQSFTGGEVVFSGINLTLDYGLNVIWVTFDIDTGIIDNDYVDAYIEANDLVVGGSYYPPTLTDPAGKRLIYNTVFFDDFEGTTEWILTGEFQKNKPLGLGGTIPGNNQTTGNPDPDYAFSGDTVLGTDLTGLGAQLGNYELISDGVYRATIPVGLDLYYYRDVKLTFQRYLNIHKNARRAFIEVSNDSAQTWHIIFNSWTMGGYFIDPTWLQKSYDISSYADGKRDVFIRFTLSDLIGSYATSGWNIDDVLITGDWVTKDVGVSDLFYPVYGCDYSSTEYPQVRVQNYGALPTPALIPVRITFNGGQTVTDTIFSSIQPSDYIDFTFTKPVDLSLPAVYSNVVVTTLMEGDEDNSLDAITTEVYSMPVIDLPYSQTFTSEPVFWRDDGNSRSVWDLNYPVKYKIIEPTNRCWSTRYNSTYVENDSAYVESPCFDFSTVQKPIFECKIWKEIDTMYNGDGAVLQYSIDDGNTWSLVPTDTDTLNWNWYNNPDIPTLGTEGWDGSSGGWITAKQFLPIDVNGQSSVKFRMFFQSDTAHEDDGIAFDDVKIYEAPHDIGVISIDSIKDNQCQYVNSPYLWVTVKNFGVLQLSTGTDIIVGLDVNGRAPVIDTFTLATPIPIGGTAPFHFTKPISLVDTGVYTVVAYTLIEDDPYFYESYNDTAIHTFSVKPAPIPGLPDYIYSVEPDTIVLIPNYNVDYTYEWHYDGSTTPTFNVPGEGDYGYTIANGTNGCAVTGTVHVVQLIPDLAPDSLLWPVNDCELSASETIIARVWNVGTDTFAAGRQVVMSYRVDSRPFVAETMLLAQTVNPGDSFIYTFTTGADLSALDVTYEIDIAVRYPYDSVYGNDMLTDAPVESYGYPDPMLGPDRTIIDTSYTLNTSTEFVDYLWNDNPDDTLNSYTLNESGSYWVTVTDTLGCVGHDTVDIFLKVRDLEMVRITNPGDTCFSGFLESVSVLIRNTGSDTIVPGEMIDMSYTINSGTAQNGTFISGSYYEPNDSFIFTFPQTRTYTVGTYNFLASIATSGDFYPDNNTFSDSYQIFSNPVVDLGDDVDGLLIASYQLDAGAGTGYSYYWRDGSTDRYYTVTAATSGMNHHVLVTNANGCQDRDTVYVYILVNDMTISGANIGDSVCMQDLDGSVYIQIRNSGNLNVLPNDTIRVGYELNGYNHMEDVVLVNGLDPFQSRNYIFTGGIDNAIEGDNTINFTIEYEDDIDPSNDTYQRDVFVRESPDVDFGQTDDTLWVHFPYTLDAGDGYISYQWQDFTTGQTLIVNLPGWYSVTVSNGICLGSFPVYVDLNTSVEVGLSASNILIYPNPANDILNIELKSSIDFNEDILLELINIQGQVVWAGKLEDGQKTTTISVQEYPAGIYFIKLYDKDDVSMKKIMIK
ncbi:MAG: T9SS type A sorting domain-containing protein [Bacteroidales bacterium]|nr:T9SS type A sorting domain-containing protein [Bacteroidales bacterium]